MTTPTARQPATRPRYAQLRTASPEQLELVAQLPAAELPALDWANITVTAASTPAVVTVFTTPAGRLQNAFVITDERAAACRQNGGWTITPDQGRPTEASRTWDRPPPPACSA